MLRSYYFCKCCIAGIKERKLKFVNRQIVWLEQESLMIAAPWNTYLLYKLNWIAIFQIFYTKNAVNYYWENIFFNITHNFYEERTLRRATVTNIVSYDATTGGVIANAQKIYVIKLLDQLQVYINSLYLKKKYSWIDVYWKLQ